MPQFWGGFVNNGLDTREVDTGQGGFGTGLTRMPAIFASRRDARREYEDVRKVEVRTVSVARTAGLFGGRRTK
jgi:hypothetical protein